jgi:hypothetical protein
MAEPLQTIDIYECVCRALEKARCLDLIADGLAASHLAPDEAQALQWIAGEIVKDVRALHDALATQLKADKQLFSTGQE